MNAPEPSDRRRFVAAVLSGVGLVVLRSIPLPDAGAAPTGPARTTARLSRLFAHAQGARQVGRAYLEQSPDEGDATALVQQVGRSLAMDAAAMHRTDDSVLRQLLERRVRQDFAEGRTTSVDGWVLSVTEARLCAVTALVRTT